MSFTGIKHSGFVTTYWIDDQQVSKADWEKYQDRLAALRPGSLLKKRSKRGR